MLKRPDVSRSLLIVKAVAGGMLVAPAGTATMNPGRSLAVSLEFAASAAPTLPSSTDDFDLAADVGQLQGCAACHLRDYASGVYPW